MWWGKDDIVDKLIGNNAARPRPGMDEPDSERLTIDRYVPPKKPRPADEESGNAVSRGT